MKTSLNKVFSKTLAADPLVSGLPLSPLPGGILTWHPSVAFFFFFKDRVYVFQTDFKLAELTKEDLELQMFLISPPKD